jgi:hypothetical protein
MAGQGKRGKSKRSLYHAKPYVFGREKSQLSGSDCGCQSSESGGGSAASLKEFGLREAKDRIGDACNYGLRQHHQQAKQNPYYSRHLCRRLLRHRQQQVECRASRRRLDIQFSADHLRALFHSTTLVGRPHAIGRLT